MDSPSLPHHPDSSRGCIRGGQGEVIPETGFNFSWFGSTDYTLVGAVRPGAALFVRRVRKLYTRYVANKLFAAS